MNKTVTFIILFLSVFALTNQAYAGGTVLVSAPLPRGTNGDFVCVCTNIGKKDIEIEVYIKYDTSGGMASVDTISRWDMLSVSTASGTPTPTAYCEVNPFSGSTGKTVTTKKVSCTFSVVDSNGSPQITVPVDTKMKY